MQYLGFTIYIILFIGATLSSKKKLSANNATLLIAIYLASNLLVIGFRPLNAGSDTESYLYNYYLIKNGYDLPLAEIGFQYLLHTLNFFEVGDDYFWPILTVIFLLLFLFSINSFDFNKKILIVFGLASSTTFFDLEANGIRQGLATAIGIFAIFNSNGLRQLLLLLIAAIFHYSAGILSIIIFANKISALRNKTLLKTMAAALGLLLLGFIFGKNFIAIENFKFLPMDLFAINKFSSYTESGLRGTYESLNFTGRVIQAIPIIILILFIANLPNHQEFKAVYFTALTLSFFYISLASTGYSYRWAYYPHLLTIYLLPWFFSKTNIPLNKIRVMNIATCFAYVLWGSYTIWINGILSWKN